MKVALVQLKSSTCKDRNQDVILRYIAKAAEDGAALVAFPEFMMFYTSLSQTPRQLAALAEDMDGPFVSAISESAKDHGIEVVGSLYEKSGKRNRVYDTSFVISSSGKVISRYRKVHLYDALGFKESDKLASGSHIARPVQTSIGKVGMMICYDLRFPEVSRLLAGAGSHVLIAPSAWVKGDMKEEHWVATNRTRAVENGCYVVAPDQVGNIYCGKSMIVDPFGRILLDMKKRQGIGYAEIDPGRIRETRGTLPLLKSRRPDVYSAFG